jgi:hypothetical protein
MQTRTALKQLSGGKIEVERVSPAGPLAKNADWLLQQHERRQADIKTAQQRHSAAAAAPMMHAARQKAEQFMREQVMPDDTPIVSRFDAFSVIKDASRKNSDDMGLRKFALHLERLWHAEPLGALSAGALTRLRDHYQGTSPRSLVGEIVDTVIPKVSFRTLPVSKLARIASAIQTQEDYDVAMSRFGLHTNDPLSVRARTFIRELVNRAASIENTEIKDVDTQTVGDTKAIKNPRSLDIKKLHGKDIATRIATRLAKDAAEFVAEEDTDVEAEVEAAPEKKDPNQSLGIEGTGILPHTAKTACGKANFNPKINTKHQDQVAIPEDAGVMLKSDEKHTQHPAKKAALPPGLEKHKFPKKKDGKPGEKKDEKSSGKPWEKKDKKAFSLDKDTIEKALVDGVTFKSAGYAILINEKDDTVNISTKTGNKKYPLVDLDNAIADFMYLASTSQHPAGSPPPPVFYVREGIRMNCPGCYETNSYEMPKTAADLTCSHCHALIPGKVVANALGADAAYEEITLVAVTPSELQDEFGDKFAKAAEMIGADGVGADGCRAEAYAINVPVAKLAEVWDFMVQAGFTPIAQEMPLDESGAEPGLNDELSPLHEEEEGQELEAAQRLEGIADEILDVADEINMEHSAQSTVTPMAPAGGMMAAGPELGGDMPSDMPEEMPGEGGMPDLGMPSEGGPGQWADWQVIQAAMMHYQHQGMGVADAISQFLKDYSKEQKDEQGNPVPAQEYDQQIVIQVASQVFGVDGGQLGDSMALGMTPPGEAGPEVEAPVPGDMGAEPSLDGIPSEAAPKKSLFAKKKKKADLPLPKVNQQQPDAVAAQSLGPDSEQNDMKGPGKIKTQQGKPQGTFSDTSHEPDSDNKDPGTFGAGKPKAQHPVTDQRGVSLPSTEMGKDSDSGDNAVTRKMEQLSRSAPQSMQSK